MNKYSERLYNGVIKENPTLVLMLGMCPTLAVTTRAFNGLGMGLTTLVVLMLSNFMISVLRNIISDKIRIPAYIVVIASLVTILQMLLQAYIPALNDSLGIYIPLIVVNCIILGRAESYASKNPPLLSMMDGVGMGLGFTIALTIIGAFREILGNGTIFGLSQITIFNFSISFPKGYEPMSIFVLAPGAFFVLALLTAFQNKMQLPSATNKKGKDCTSGCANCNSQKGGK
ncbi:MAG TPA: electron transport complex subunit E [Candidatus Merdenecus merdavium]|nr:electron transport complex subunit E [Candidatus Merdenecus merdavium]